MELNYSHRLGSSGSPWLQVVLSLTTTPEALTSSGQAVWLGLFERVRAQVPTAAEEAHGLHALEGCPHAEEAAQQLTDGTEWAGLPPVAILTGLREGLDLEAGLAVAARLAREARGAL